MRPVPYLLVACLATPPLAAQRLSGTVLDFDGRPTAHAIVRSFDRDGTRIGELLTDRSGAFRCGGDRAVASLEVQLEGVALEVAIRESPPELRISFENEPYFTLRGRVTDPSGQPMPRVDVALRTNEWGMLATATTDSAGAFAIRANRAVQVIDVDPLGLHHEVPGPYAANQNVDIDLHAVRTGFFSIEGRVIGEDGSPLAGASVRGASAKIKRVQRHTKKDGSFVLWSRQPLDYVIALDHGDPIALRYEQFKRNTAIELDARKHGYVFVTGKVVDAAGNPAPYVGVFAADENGGFVPGLPMLSRTDVDGEFVARLPHMIPRLLAWREEPEREAGFTDWEPAEAVVITIR